MLGRIMEAVFYSTAIAIVVLVVGLNCLQGAVGLKLFGFIEGCNFGITSEDIRIKAGATVILVLFLALLFGPILAVLQSHRIIRRPKRSK